MPVSRENVSFQFGFTAQLLQTFIAAVMGVAAPIRGLADLGVL